MKASKTYKAKLHKLDGLGYDEHGRYFGVPFTTSSGLQRVYRIEADGFTEGYVRATNQRSALEEYAAKRPGRAIIRTVTL